MRRIIELTSPEKPAYFRMIIRNSVWFPYKKVPGTLFSGYLEYFYNYFVAGLLHHAAHTTGRHCRSCGWLRDVCDRALGGEEHSCN